MTPQLGRYLLIALPVMLLSGAALYEARAPYGWFPVLVVYLLATFPLSVLLADRLLARVNLGSALVKVMGKARKPDPPPELRRYYLPGLAVVCAVFGLAFVAVTGFAGKHFTEWVLRQEADLLGRQGMLGVWCILLQVPLCVVGCSLARLPRAESASTPSGVSILLALFVAVILPTVYLTRLIESESKKAEEHLQAGRLARAHPLVMNLHRIGSNRPLNEKTPRVVLWEYFVISNAEWRRYNWTPTTDDDRMERAGRYASQGDYDQAEKVLLRVSNPTPEAVLLLASVYKEQQKWKDCNQCCRAAIKLLERFPRNDETLPFWVQVYDNLGAAAQEQRRYADAQAAYEEALRRVSPARAHFHLQLGRLHHAAGRPGKALHHLDEAAKLDPEGYGVRAKPVLDEIRTQTPSCLLRWWGP